MDKGDRNNIIMLMSGTGVTIGVYLIFKYAFPIVAPFVVSFLIAYCIEKPVNRLSSKLKGNKILASSIIVFILTALFMVAVGYVGYQAFREVKAFVVKYDYYMEIANCKVCDICVVVDRWLGFQQGTSMTTINNNMDGIMEMVKTKVIPAAMGVSIPVLIRVVALVGVFFIIIMSVAFVSKDMDAVRKWRDATMFSEVVMVVSSKLGELGRVYFRVQLLIMACTAAICTAGLLVIGNPYALVLGILIGLLDALPLFGTGTVLIPWAIVLILGGQFKNAAVLFTVYIIAYFVREIMESKLMGNRLGIAPFTMMMIIYAGILLYGLLGFILGPVSYVIIKSLILYLKTKVERGNIIDI